MTRTERFLSFSSSRRLSQESEKLPTYIFSLVRRRRRVPKRIWKDFSFSVSGIFQQASSSNIGFFFLGIILPFSTGSIFGQAYLEADDDEGRRREKYFLLFRAKMTSEARETKRQRDGKRSQPRARRVVETRRAGGDEES